MAANEPAQARWRKLAAWLLAMVALACVFMAYLDPHAVADLGNRLWSCF